MKGVQDAIVRWSIGAPEVVWRIVKHTHELFWNWRNFKLGWFIQQNAYKLSTTVILAVKAKFSVTGSSKKVSTNKCNTDKQPEIAMWIPKPEVLISQKACQTSSKFQR